MAKVPRSWLRRLHKLSLGPVEGAMVRWSYHDGSTWAMIVFEEYRKTPRNIIGWAVFTLQEAPHPIIGVYVDKKRRGRGYGTALVSRLLEKCAPAVPYGKIYAVADWWPKYTQLFADAGFELLEWD